MKLNIELAKEWYDNLPKATMDSQTPVISKLVDMGKNAKKYIDYKGLAIKPSFKKAQREYTENFLIRNKMKNPKQQ